jgi:hypothetical protein
MGYSPAKKKGGHVARVAGGGRRTRSDRISPCDPFNGLNDDAIEACDDDNDKDKGDPNYLPTPTYKKISQVACKPKTPTLRSFLIAVTLPSFVP